MTEEIAKLFREQDERLQRRLDAAVEALASRQDESNRIYAASEVRAREAEVREARRAAEYDERNARTEERSERQTRAWEQIAAALRTMVLQRNSPAGQEDS